MSAEGGSARLWACGESGLAMTRTGWSTAARWCWAGFGSDCGRRLAGHSDADAVLHAVTDAILGAIAAGDIGELFPDTDARWQDADSSVFVARAIELAADQGCRVANCDVTVLAEEPKLSPYKRQMRERIAELLGVEIDHVSVKAKTGEGMGAIGRGEGIAVMAAALVARADGEAPSR